MNGALHGETGGQPIMRSESIKSLPTSRKRFENICHFFVIIILTGQSSSSEILNLQASF